MSLLASFDWGAIWDNRGVLAGGPLADDPGLRDRHRAAPRRSGIVLGAVRAYRIPVLTPARRRLRRDHPQHADPRADLLPLLRRCRVRSARTSRHSRAVHRGLARGDDLGRRVQHRELPRRLRGRPVPLPRGRASRSASAALATFFRVTLPIGGRIALPSTINTYVSVLKNTSLMTAIGFQELNDDVALDLGSNFRDVEMLATVGGRPTSRSSGRSPALMRLLERRLSRSRTRDEPPAARLEPRHQRRRCSLVVAGGRHPVARGTSTRPGRRGGTPCSTRSSTSG